MTAGKAIGCKLGQFTGDARIGRSRHMQIHNLSLQDRNPELGGLYQCMLNCVFPEIPFYSSVIQEKLCTRLALFIMDTPNRF
jgi:hypothetical protein